MSWYDPRTYSNYNPIKWATAPIWAPPTYAGKAWDWGKDNLDPAKGSNTAAAGATAAGNSYLGLGEQQWGRAMEGLSGAMGQTTGSTAFAIGSGFNPQWHNPATKSVYENASSFFGDPSNSYMRNSYPGLSSQLSGPSHSQGAYSTAQGYLNGPTQQSQLSRSFDPSKSASAYAGYSGIYGQPGQMERYADGAMSQLGAPGSYEDWYGANKNAYSAPSNLGRLYSENWGGYGAQGRTEGYRPTATGYAQDYAGGAGMRMSGPTATQQAAGGIAGQYGQAQYNGAPINNLITDAALDQRAGQYFGGSTHLQGFAERQLPGMEREGDFEQFARSAIAGDNPAIARAREQGMEALNQQLASRGRFNSGAAGFTLGNFASDMAAKEWEFKGAMADRMQQSRQQRLAQAQGMAGAASGERMEQGRGFLGLDMATADNRLSRAGAYQGLGESQARLALARASGLQGLAGQLDDGAFRREDALARAAGMASGESLANTGNEMAANEAADRTRLARLAGMSSLAQATDASNLDWLNSAGAAAGNAQRAAEGRIGLGADIAGRAQSAGLARAAGGMAAAGQVDQDYLARLGEERARAGGADSSTLAAQLGLFGMANQLDTTDLARVRQQWGMGQDLDKYGLDSFSTMGSLANAYDTQWRGGQGDLFDMNYRSDMLRAGLYSGFYSSGMNAYGGAMGNAFNAFADAAALKGAGQSARARLPWDAASLYTKYKTGRG